MARRAIQAARSSFCVARAGHDDRPRRGPALIALEATSPPRCASPASAAPWWSTAIASPTPWPSAPTPSLSLHSDVRVRTSNGRPCRRLVRPPRSGLRGAVLGRRRQRPRRSPPRARPRHRRDVGFDEIPRLRRRRLHRHLCRRRGHARRLRRPPRPDQRILPPAPAVLVETHNAHCASSARKRPRP